MPGWLLSLTDAEDRLSRTDFLASAVGPGALCRWLEPLTGPEIALELVRRARAAMAAGSGDPSESGQRAAV